MVVAALSVPAGTGPDAGAGWFFRPPRPDRWYAEPADLCWAAETAAARRVRRRWLRWSDGLLTRLEDANVAEEGRGGELAAAFPLVRAYAALGGTPCWPGPWPTGAELHEALLDLQCRWMLPLLAEGEDAGDG